MRLIPPCAPARRCAASSGSFAMPCCRKRRIPPKRRSSHLSTLCRTIAGAAHGLGLGQGTRRVSAVTAARPDEGKTTLCIALARALAAAGVKVLAIDGDIRQPELQPSFQYPWRAGAGGPSGRTGGAGGSPCPRHCDSAGRITRRHAKPRRVESVSFPGLAPLNGKLREDYELILLDAPPAFALAEGV